MISGKFVRGEFASADASAGGSFTLYDGDGNTVTLSATQRVAICDILLSADTAMRAEVFFGADATVDNGERLYAAYLTASNGFAMVHTSPMLLPKSRTPRVKTSAAGNVRGTFGGLILEA